MQTFRMRWLPSAGRSYAGVEFEATEAERRALVAIGRAEVVERAQTYLTRDMQAMPVSAPAAVEPEAVAEPENEVLISDSVREYAAEHNIDLSAIVGTGLHGRILKRDITAAIGDE